ncbi:MAG: DUF4954 family protein [Bacteroidaceae bacterium]|nr:DUF4954 family protein [Bacteroidaceae bacterium]
MYRSLNIDEIEQLQRQGCTAENWRSITVSDNFSTEFIRDVNFYGEVSLGSFTKDVEIAPNVKRHSGIYRSSIGNYEIGDDCYISNVGLLQNTGEAEVRTKTIAVLNEAGDGNIIAYNGLTSNLAALMVYCQRNNRQAYENLVNLVRNATLKIDNSFGRIGHDTIIHDVKEIVNCRIGNYCEISGAQRLTDCSIEGDGEANIFVGTGVVLEDCILVNGASVLNNALLANCFVGEACTISNGFQAENSVFFANTYMSNGEACAAFCGPFTASHHKSSLLIGVDLSFYNAGSATNYSNHAYKMGPVHYGTLERGSKTASGAHILHPAKVGAFSMCMNKISTHPDTTDFPFSYLFGDGKKTWLVPARNLCTLGTYRDVNKWPKRDKRESNYKRSLINFSWLSPYVMEKIEKAIDILEYLQKENGYDITEYEYKGCTIRRSSLTKALEIYRNALLMFVSMNNKDIATDHYEVEYIRQWHDLGGMLLPKVELDNIINNVEYNEYSSIEALETSLKESFEAYNDYLEQYTLYIIDKYFADTNNLDEMAEDAYAQWIEAIKADATKEFEMGDVEQEAYEKIIGSLK